MNAEIQRLIEAEVERRVVRRLAEEKEEINREEIIERFREIFDFMERKEQIKLLLDLVNPGEESLCDSFGEGTWGMDKYYKSRVAITMILQNLLGD